MSSFFTVRSAEEFELARLRWVELVEVGRLGEALELAEQACRWAEASGEELLAERAELNRLAIAVELGEGMSCSDRLRQLLLEAHDGEHAFLAAYTLARAHELAGDSRKALFYARQSRERARSLEAGRQAASANLMGNQLASEGRFAEAVAEYRAALAQLDGSDSLRAAVIRQNLGYCLARSGHAGEGLDHLLRSARWLGRHGALRHEAQARLDLAFVRLELGQPVRAVRHARRALALAEKLGWVEGEQNARFLLGCAYRDLGEEFLARREFSRLQQAFCPDSEYLVEALLAWDVRPWVNLRGSR